MNLFDVYPLNDIEIVKASGSTVWDASGQEYLDLYGGHAVISIGHTHPHRDCSLDPGPLSPAARYPQRLLLK